MTAKVYAFPTGRVLDPAECQELATRAAGAPERGVIRDASLFLAMLRADAPDNAGDEFDLPEKPIDAYTLGIGHAINALTAAMDAHGVQVPA